MTITINTVKISPSMTVDVATDSVSGTVTVNWFDNFYSITNGNTTNIKPVSTIENISLSFLDCTTFRSFIKFIETSAAVVGYNY